MTQKNTCPATTDCETQSKPEINQQRRLATLVLAALAAICCFSLNEARAQNLQQQQQQQIEQPENKSAVDQLA